MNLIKYQCPRCGTTETEYDCFARLFRSGEPPTCEGTFFTFTLDPVLPAPPPPTRAVHEQTQMEVVPELN